MSSAEDSVKNGCIFCNAYAAGDDRSALTLWRWELCFAVLNRYPYTSGHTMVAPIAHVGDLDELDDAALTELMMGCRLVVRAIRRAYRPEGFNLGLNLGASAGAGVPDHLHLHVVPRWRGDVSFMTSTAGTRVIPDSLEATHEKVTAALRAIAEGRV